MERRRFERIEKGRPGAPVPVPPAPSVGRRFGAPPGVPPVEPPAGGAPVGSSRARFEAPEPPPDGLRVLEDDAPAFVRCAECRCDNHATAVRCRSCQTDLNTPAQREFNEMFWRARLEEDAAEAREAERVRERQAEANREAHEAQRRMMELQAELGRRAERGEPLEGDPQQGAAVRSAARAAGTFIGGWIRRAFPDRRVRIGFLVACAVAVAAGGWFFTSVRWTLLIVFSVLVMGAGSVWGQASRTRRPGWRITIRRDRS
jgi:hypothetical protein